MTAESDAPIIAVPPPRPRRWVTIVLCTLIFLAGGVVGTGITLLLKLEKWPRPTKTFLERRDRLTNRIARNLSLDAEQTEKLRTIVEKHMWNIETIRQKILPDMKAESDSLDRELRAILNEEQLRKWDELYGTLRKNWFHRPIPGRGPDGRHFHSHEPPHERRPHGRHRPPRPPESQPVEAPVAPR